MLVLLSTFSYGFQCVWAESKPNMTPVFVVPVAYALAAAVAVIKGGAIVGAVAEGEFFTR